MEVDRCVEVEEGLKKMKEMNWVIEVIGELEKTTDSATEMRQWSKRSIYKIPDCTKIHSKRSYKPLTISFGPYHHGEQLLMPMEDHKLRALLHFLKRSRKPLQLYVASLMDVIDDLKGSYDSLEEKWKLDTDGFLKMMILDGSFMLEALRTATHTMGDYAPNDPIFSGHGQLYFMPYIKRDMLMLENQLPILVLEKLVEVENDDQNLKADEFILRLIMQFWSSGSHYPRIGKCVHVLDVYRKSLLLEEPHKRTRLRNTVAYAADAGDEIIRSATELHDAGIRFKKSKSSSLRDISFRGGVLRLPFIMVDDTTEPMFLNLMAFERFHVGAGNDVTSYIFLMDNLIDSARDVALLHSKDIIQNAIGSDEAVAKLFNTLSKEVALDPASSLNLVHQKVNDYCKKRWNEWRANLIHTYFRNPWASLSLVAAIALFGLTIVQTWFAVHPVQ
uniref:Uncharacterized protein n=1 Tax=Kalanchoe fedtschenkoi TaxID=63787 RepID=A0A7N0UAA4_KALFE